MVPDAECDYGWPTKKRINIPCNMETDIHTRCWIRSWDPRPCTPGDYCDQLNQSSPPPTPHPQKTYMVPVKPMNQQNKHFDLTVTARDLHPYCSKGGNTLDIEINVNKNLSAMTFCHGAGQLYDGSITSKNFVHGK